MARGRVLCLGQAVQLRPGLGTSPAVRAGRWTMHEIQSYRCVHPPASEVVPLDGKGRVHFADGRQGSSRFFFPFSTTCFGQNF